MDAETLLMQLDRGLVDKYAKDSSKLQKIVKLLEAVSPRLCKISKLIAKNKVEYVEQKLILMMYEHICRNFMS